MVDAVRRLPRQDRCRWWGVGPMLRLSGSRWSSVRACGCCGSGGSVAAGVGADSLCGGGCRCRFGGGCRWQIVVAVVFGQGWGGLDRCGRLRFGPRCCRWFGGVGVWSGQRWSWRSGSMMGVAVGFGVGWWLVFGQGFACEGGPLMPAVRIFLGGRPSASALREQAGQAVARSGRFCLGQGDSGQYAVASGVAEKASRQAGSARSGAGVALASAVHRRSAAATSGSSSKSRHVSLTTGGRPVHWTARYVGVDGWLGAPAASMADWTDVTTWPEAERGSSSAIDAAGATQPTCPTPT